jgi:hypothetical protein
MVSISHESADETDARLRRVLAATRLDVMPSTYAFAESPTSEPLQVADGALAIVRDETIWSQLVPSPNGTAERFDLWCFHFPAGVDNSGFVGWLCTHIKRRFGSGVIVICGHNSGDGGVFDYYGCPAGLGAEMVAFIRELGETPIMDTAVAPSVPPAS